MNDETKREESELVVEFVETPACSTWHPVALEAQILACLESRPEPRETVDLAFRRKERDLMALFDQLSVTDARELNRRLSRQWAGDSVAAAFSRLISERRSRLLAFLADARRREALRFGRGTGKQCA
jgi:hypothetical protein